MSFELAVSGGRVVPLPRWQNLLAQLGARVEFHPDFRIETHAGLLPVAITVEKANLFRGVERYRRAGTLAAEFELCTWALGSSADEDQIAARRAHFEAMRAAQPGTSSSVPERMLQRLEDESLSIAFTTTADRTGADYLAQVLCAAGYALESGGRLDNASESTHHEGDEIFGALARMLGDFLDDEGTVVGEPFKGWR